MLTILASYAQEESLSASENQKWRIKRNFENGMPWNGTLLGYSYENGKYIIVPDEAETVRLIFDSYLSGMGVTAIMKMLNEKGICSRNGNSWCKSSVMRVLKNYAYTGNLLLQQTYRENHLTKRTLQNNGELPQYHITDSHEAIIPLQQFNAVQDTQYIQSNPDWQFVCVYTDEGISATNTKKRDGFNRMVQDALDGKIDLIVTKSVSRFARNTVDSLTTVRKLKEKGVEVYFEKEYTYTKLSFTNTIYCGYY